MRMWGGGRRERAGAEKGRGGNSSWEEMRAKCRGEGRGERRGGGKMKRGREGRKRVLRGWRKEERVFGKETLTWKIEDRTVRMKG